ncbi:Heat shock 70 kDa protein, mitochondrial [Linum grandiflorum]
MVAFNEKGELLVGTPAKQQAASNPTNTVFGTKRIIGRKFHNPQTLKEMRMVPYKIVKDSNGDDAWVEANGQRYSPSEIGAFVLTKMKETAESYLQRTVSKAVITVPAYFTHAQRKATKDAGKIAGLNVFDLGGGTLDVSILQISNGVFELKATNGDTFLGVQDFDNAVLRFLVREFNKTESIDLRKDRFALQRVREAAEKAKIELSSTTQTEIDLPFITGGKHLSITLTRSKFESLVEKLIERTKEACKNCLKDAGVESKDIDEVVLVGGMTRVPKVQETVLKIFEKSPIVKLGANRDENVAMGAAIQGGILRGDLKDLLLLFVMPLSLVVETEGDIFTRLISRNTPITVEKSQACLILHNQTRIGFKVFQGEPERDYFLAAFDLVGLPPSSGSVPQLKVRFHIDASSILTVSAKDVLSGKEQEINIRSSSASRWPSKDDEVGAEQFAKHEDAIFMVRILASSYSRVMEKSLKEYIDKIPSE